MLTVTGVTASVIATFLCVSPLVPTTLTTYNPRGTDDVVERVRVEVAEEPEVRVTTRGLNVMVTPESCGERVALRVTFPAKPFTLVTVTVSEIDDPAGTAKVGFPPTAYAITR